ncbi:MAG: protein kinase [bacterium]|nr:protein kinase [bacterium]
MSDEDDRTNSNSDKPEEIIADSVEQAKAETENEIDQTLSVNEAAQVTAGELPPVRSDPSHSEAPTLSSDTISPSGREPAAQTGPLRKFANFELVKEIARGGMGVVYLARQPALNRTVALKMILAGEFASRNAVQRFHAEAEAAAQLDHPNIVPIYDVGESSGQHYFAMAFVDGPSLSAMASQQPFHPREACEIMRKIAAAIHYAHERGIIHRDLKPQNVLVDQGNQPRVTDFGLAKQIEGNSDLTGTGQILGTPSYMPPEQAGGDGKHLGPTADVYSLGAILYYLLVGRPPFQAANALDTLLQVIEQDPAPPRSMNADIPRDLETICLKCLEKDPDRRYQSAQDLEADLQRFANDEPILARPLGIVGRTFRFINHRSFASGIIAFLVGLLLVAGGIAGVVFAIGFSVNSFILGVNERWKPTLTLPLDVADEVTSEPFYVNASDLHALDLMVEVRTKSIEVKEAKRHNEEAEYIPQFNLPIKVDVIDEDGTVLFTDRVRLAWNASSRISMGTELSPSKRSALVKPIGSLGRFRGPPMGPVQVRLAFEKDPLYASRIEKLDLRVYEGVRDNTAAARIGAGFCVASPIVMIIGLALLIYGPLLMRRQKKRQMV